MTTIERPAREEELPAASAPSGRRGPLRLSSGHLTMIVAGLLAVVLNYAVLRALDDSVQVAVAAGPLAAGQTLQADDLVYADLRAEAGLVATLVTPEDVPGLAGWVVTAALEPGEVLRRGDLQAPSAPEARRAMSIPVDPEHAVAGALTPGDRVDVIEVVGRTASYLVSDAEVLAVPEAQPTGIAGGLRAFSVTVAVDDATALRIAVAIRSGQVELVRSTGSTPAAVERVEEEEPGRATGALEPDAEPQAGVADLGGGAEPGPATAGRGIAPADGWAEPAREGSVRRDG